MHYVASKIVQKKGTRTRLNNDKISSLDYFLSLDEEGLDNSENQGLPPNFSFMMRRELTLDILEIGVRHSSWVDLRLIIL